MTILIWGMTLSLVGKLTLALSLILAHGKVMRQHEIDEAVIQTFKWEKTLGIIGVVFLVVGYILELHHFVGLSFLLGM